MNMVLLTFLALKAKYKWGSGIESPSVASLSTWRQGARLIPSEREYSVRICQSFLSEEIGRAT